MESPKQSTVRMGPPVRVRSIAGGQREREDGGTGPAITATGKTPGCPAAGWALGREQSTITWFASFGGQAGFRPWASLAGDECAGWRLGGPGSAHRGRRRGAGWRRSPGSALDPETGHQPLDMRPRFGHRPGDGGHVSLVLDEELHDPSAEHLVLLGERSGGRAVGRRSFVHGEREVLASDDDRLSFLHPRQVDRGEQHPPELSDVERPVVEKQRPQRLQLESDAGGPLRCLLEDLADEESEILLPRAQSRNGEAEQP